MTRTSDYPVTTIPGCLSRAELKSALKKIDGALMTDLKEVRVNNELRGCSGFITSPDNGLIVYVNTEPSVYKGTMLVRTAKSTRDFTGGRNHAVSGRAELLDAAIDLLEL